VDTYRESRYDFDGAKYAQASDHQRQWGAHLIAELALTGSERVLDLGCGDAAFTAHIADLVPHGEVVGVDSSPGMIRAAHANARPNLRLLLMDINSLELSERFDVIYSNATLHWVKDHRRLYESLVPLLSDRARMRFNFAGEGNCDHFLAVAREVMSQEEFAEAFAEFDWPWFMPSVDDYRELVEACSVPNTRIWGETADRLFPSADAMVAWLDQPSLVPFVGWLPGQLACRFRERVVHGMIERTRQPDGRCFEAFRRINLLAAC
jgi:trans-aconitate methyltransferase